jgi:DNA-binding MltR family transcriptional regulator
VKPVFAAFVMSDDDHLGEIRRKAAEIAEMIRDIGKATDTAYVIVTATALENLLEQALLTNMRDLSATAYSDLFKGYGPLSSFAAKIDLAFALKIIDREVKSGLHVVRDIRNKFAHAMTLAHFDKPELAEVFQKLPGWKKGANAKEIFSQQVVTLKNIIDTHIEQSIFANAFARKEKLKP